ncbi:molybdenum ABC transporter ATP-binding protein ModC [Vibrio sp. OCN044]|uniref:Molybdenum ABC transporter ATP-binding protein ModC n=1 Tax=Vibrio tetraodonis subsp. pristinus TaxID=2695891 RepID=A0A6L8LVS0_9VIBR|nr:molybdenum ABC transporter ATP-binding protein ModC [Vibrio tetraodonis]MYM58760.1 molybdenum ABC transporter ATP-binding protein ModC [Vibrio tetraodonis subsp. pristinus]
MNSIRVCFKQNLGHTKFDIDVTIPNKGITSVFGKSGAGKTSLINVIAGLNRPEQGEIVVSGTTLFCSETKVNVPTHKRKVGYVFQDSRLFPHYSVKGNLLYGVTEPDTQHFNKILNLLDLQSLLHRYPSQLSGGEKQRVAIGRALLCKPAVLLMDEPLASLDMPLKKEVLPYLEHLAQEIQLPIIYVSHSLYELVRLANHIVVIDSGKVVASGPLEAIWDTPALSQWRTSSLHSSLFEASLASHNKHYALSRLKLAENVDLWVQKLEVPLESKLRIQVKAADVSISLDKPSQTSIRNILPSKVVEISNQDEGDQSRNVYVKLELAEERFLWAEITAWARDELELKKGLNVFAQIKGVSVTTNDIVLKT